MFDKVPFYGQVLIFIGLAMGIVGVAYYIAPNLKQTSIEIEQLEGEKAEKERKVAEGLAIEQRLPEFEREIANLTRKLGDVQQILPTAQETDRLLRWIKNTGDQSNLELKSFNPRGLEDAEFYKRFPIELQVIGGYHDLGVFLDRVSKHNRIINVDNLKMNQSQIKNSDKTIRASFTATTFVYDESDGATTEGS